MYSLYCKPSTCQLTALPPAPLDQRHDLVHTSGLRHERVLALQGKRVDSIGAGRGLVRRDQERHVAPVPQRLPEALFGMGGAVFREVRKQFLALKPCVEIRRHAQMQARKPYEWIFGHSGLPASLPRFRSLQPDVTAPDG